MKKTKRIFVWLYMAALCCAIIVGAVLCIRLSGATFGDLSTEKANASEVFQIEDIADEQVPMADGADE